MVIRFHVRQRNSIALLWPASQANTHTHNKCNIYSRMTEWSALTLTFTQCTQCYLFGARQHENVHLWYFYERPLSGRIAASFSVCAVIFWLSRVRALVTVCVCVSWFEWALFLFWHSVTFFGMWFGWMGLKKRYMHNRRGKMTIDWQCALRYMPQRTGWRRGWRKRREGAK